jgi:signal transduction histidine kinase
MTRQEVQTGVLGPGTLGELERLSRIGWLSAGLTHDLNNALLCVLGELDTIEARLTRARGAVEPAPSPAAGEDWNAHLAACEQAVDNMRAQLGAIVDHARDLQQLHRAGAVVKPGRRCELLAAAARAIRLSRTRLRATVHLTAEGSLTVGVDETTIVRVMLNLLLNADDALRAAGREPGQIDVRVTRIGDRAVCDIADDGQGIDPAILPHLFEPFASSKPEGKGTGLGLAVSRLLVRGLGADLELVSTGPEGTTFRLSMPVTAPAPSGRDV